MTWADAHYDLAQDVQWTMSLARDLRAEIRAERFGDTFFELSAAAACAMEFTRSELIRRRCAALLSEAEQARAAHGERVRA